MEHLRPFAPSPPTDYDRWARMEHMVPTRVRPRAPAKPKPRFRDLVRLFGVRRASER